MFLNFAEAVATGGVVMNLNKTIWAYKIFANAMNVAI